MKLPLLVTVIAVGAAGGAAILFAEQYGTGSRTGGGVTEYPPLPQQSQQIPPPPPGPYQSHGMGQPPPPGRPPARRMDYPPLGYSPEGSGQKSNASDGQYVYPHGSEIWQEVPFRSTIGKTSVPPSTPDNQYPRETVEGMTAMPASPYYLERNRPLPPRSGQTSGDQSRQRPPPPAYYGEESSKSVSPPQTAYYPPYSSPDREASRQPPAERYIPPSYNPYGVRSGYRQSYGVPPNPWQLHSPGPGYGGYPGHGYSPYSQGQYYQRPYPPGR